jgi:hypothetical protein
MAVTDLGGLLSGLSTELQLLVTGLIVSFAQAKK